MSTKKAAFFFGSGISYPSFDKDVASVDGITGAAFNEDWHFTTCKTFGHGKPPSPYIPDDVTPAVVAFLQKVRACADEYIAYLDKSPKPRKAHYEDLFSLSEQASQPESTYVPNLAVVAFLRRLRKDTRSIYTKFKNPVVGSDSFVTLAQLSCDYLHWVVDHVLRCRSRKRAGLSLIVQAARSVKELDIFTLNHDTFVEEQFKGSGLNCEMGFGDRSRGNFSVYQPGWADPRKPRATTTRLFKLHGSLNWYLYEIPESPRPFRQYAIPDGDPYHVRDNRGRDVRPADWKAAFLSGTIVKEQRYGYGFWSELFSAFQEYLTHHTHLICCGYGFGDPGVNLRLEQWTRNLSGKNTLVILTPEPARTYLVRKPIWMQQLWTEGRVVLIPQYLKDCKLRQIEKYFD
ncbi:MAG: SIR2 family protein [Opitutaceae bacterium]|jgi:hypothetical protein